MKLTIVSRAALTVLVVLLAAALTGWSVAAAHGDEHHGSSDHAAKSGKKYACSMGCKICDKPGACPVCGMEMEELPADNADAEADADHDEDVAYTGDPYYLSTSPTGKVLGDNPVVANYNGRELRFADKADEATFEKSPDNYLKQVDAKMVSDQLPYYALTNCPVTDEKLGGMGDTVNYIYNNRLVRFCCEGCIDEFSSHPDDYLKKLDAAEIDKQKASYPTDHCLVLTDETIGGPDTRDIVVASRLFRLCCGDCVTEVHKNPAKWLKVLSDKQHAGHHS